MLTVNKGVYSSSKIMITRDNTAQQYTQKDTTTMTLNVSEYKQNSVSRQNSNCVKNAQTSLLWPLLLHDPQADYRCPKTGGSKWRISDVSSMCLLQQRILSPLPHKINHNPTNTSQQSQTSNVYTYT